MGEYGSGATVVNIQLTWVVADGRPENSLQMGSPTSTHRARRSQEFRSHSHANELQNFVFTVNEASIHERSRNRNAEDWHDDHSHQR